jgi:hypothetical protein
MRRLIWEVHDYSNCHKGLERVEIVNRFRKFSDAIALVIRYGEYDLQIRRRKRKHEISRSPRKHLAGPASLDIPF